MTTRKIHFEMVNYRNSDIQIKSFQVRVPAGSGDVDGLRHEVVVHESRVQGEQTHHQHDISSIEEHPSYLREEQDKNGYTIRQKIDRRQLIKKYINELYIQQ